MMTQYLLRLDDAADHCNLENWLRIENMLDSHGIKPIVGIIPVNRDPHLLEYRLDCHFWERALEWQAKGWCIALHGYEHVYETESGGINPVNRRSEFASIPLKSQEEKIEKGLKALKERGLKPSVFFAPAHTFDIQTLRALKNKSDIRIISDTVANDMYYEGDFFFIPQQAGAVRRLPFKLVTFCYHPNNMKDSDFARLERFIIRNRSDFADFSRLVFSRRKRNIYDRILSLCYLNLRSLMRIRK